MRKVIIMFALAMGIATANAQENVTVEQNNGSNEQPTLTKEVYPQKEADGDQTKDQETILQIKSLTKPAYSALMAWKEMNSYRNQALAHNHRDKYQKNIYLQNKKFDAPQTDDELLLVAFCIHKMSQVTSLFFQDEIIKIINILEKIIQENKNKNKGRYEFNNKCIQKIKSIDKDITNSFIHYNFTNTLLDTLRKNNSNI